MPPVPLRAQQSDLHPLRPRVLLGLCSTVVRGEARMPAVPRTNTADAAGATLSLLSVLGCKPPAVSAHFMCAANTLHPPVPSGTFACVVLAVLCYLANI
jgi:hypothetical protein